ncbi:GNAT family N-acetyltransferase [Chryseobacterium sp. CT-SW4]|uniref:GNAT family N-acetyltransferase n=1 Tax=Chryseobacterium sp. SW-1 TaxID=3157343 RepID=UPI003B01A839
MIFREATIHDLPILLEFEQGVVSAERPFNLTLTEGEIHYYDLNSLMESPDSVLMVAEENGEVFASGYATIKNKEKPYYNFEQYAYLGFMFVKPEYRGKGINQLILEHLTEWCKTKGISEVRLEVYDRNESAVRAYEKAGFEPLLLSMRRKI